MDYNHFFTFSGIWRCSLVSGPQSSLQKVPWSFLIDLKSWYETWVPYFPSSSFCLIPLQSKELSRVFSSTTIQKHQFFSAQPSLWSNLHICIWLLEKLLLWVYGSLLAKWCLCFFNMLSRFVIAFLPRSKCILILFHLWCWEKLKSKGEGGNRGWDG